MRWNWTLRRLRCNLKQTPRGLCEVDLCQAKASKAKASEEADNEEPEGLVKGEAMTYAEDLGDDELAKQRAAARENAAKFAASLTTEEAAIYGAKQQVGNVCFEISVLD